MEIGSYPKIPFFVLDSWYWVHGKNPAIVLRRPYMYPLLIMYSFYKITTRPKAGKWASSVGVGARNDGMASYEEHDRPTLTGLIQSVGPRVERVKTDPPMHEHNACLKVLECGTCRQISRWPPIEAIEARCREQLIKKGDGLNSRRVKG